MYLRGSKYFRCMNRVVTFIVSLIVSLNCVAQVEVTAFSAGANEGVTYMLPDTKIEVTVELKCITSKPGEFARYADRYLRIADAVTVDSKEWILDRVSVRTKGIPNINKAFTVALGNSPASNMILTDDGIIQAVNRSVEVVQEKQEVKDEVVHIDPGTYLTEEILQATSTAKMAELVSREIYTIRESKLAITRGTADNMPKDGLSMQLVLDELNKQEQALTELFTGRTDTVKYEYKLSFTPTENSDTTRAVLFRFSRKLGLLDADNLAGSPVYYDFSRHKLQTPVAETKNKKQKKEIKKAGICYILPGRADFRIYQSGKELYNEALAIAQYGTVEVLSKDLFSKKANTRILFDTSTGSIISIEK